MFFSLMLCHLICYKTKFGFFTLLIAKIVIKNKTRNAFKKI